jgi:hypothetical protein
MTRVTRALPIVPRISFALRPDALSVASTRPGLNLHAEHRLYGARNVGFATVGHVTTSRKLGGYLSERHAA